MIIDVTRDVIKENLMRYGNTMNQQRNGYLMTLCQGKIGWTHVVCKQVECYLRIFTSCMRNKKKLPLMGKEPRFSVTYEKR